MKNSCATNVLVLSLYLGTTPAIYILTSGHSSVVFMFLTDMILVLGKSFLFLVNKYNLMSAAGFGILVAYDDIVGL